MNTRVVPFALMLLLSIPGIFLRATSLASVLPLPGDESGPGLVPSPQPLPMEWQCVVTVAKVNGEVSIEKNDPKSATGRSRAPLSEGEVFNPGAAVATGPGALLQLFLPDGSVVQIGPNSVLHIDRLYCEKGDPPFALRLTAGTMWGNIASAGRGEMRVNLETETAIVGASGTNFTVETYQLDTVIHRHVTSLPSSESGVTGDETDTAAVEIPFKGLVTRVVAYNGSARVTEKSKNETITVDAFMETTVGIPVTPLSATAMNWRGGFDANGQLRD